MTNIVLDASALLVLLNEEQGHEIVKNHLSNAIMSSVNYSEVLSILVANKMPLSIAQEVVAGLLVDIVPFDTIQATLAASLRLSTQSLGLSLGDRACLALGKELKCAIVTADKVWNKIDLGIEIILVR